MIAIAQLLSAFAACAAQALAMNRHRRDVGVLPLDERTRWLLRVAGTLLLCVSFGVAVIGRGWGVGSVEWFCLFGLAASCLVVMLNYAPQHVPSTAWIAVATTVIWIAAA